MWQFVDEQRSNKHLPPLAEEDIPHFVDNLFRERLGQLNGEYAHVINSSPVLNIWKDSYLKKTPCIQRLTAFYSR